MSGLVRELPGLCPLEPRLQQGRTRGEWGSHRGFSREAAGNEAFRAYLEACPGITITQAHGVLYEPLGSQWVSEFRSF